MTAYKPVDGAEPMVDDTVIEELRSCNLNVIQAVTAMSMGGIKSLEYYLERITINAQHIEGIAQALLREEVR